MKMFGFLAMVMALTFATLVSANSIRTDQINFEPNSSRTHNQIITVDVPSDLKVILNPNFNLTWSSPTATTDGDNISWSSVTSVQFNLTSPVNCTKGDVYRMPVYVNNINSFSFTFICIDDKDVVDYKGEYGHGDGNYLNDNYRYLPANTDISLFNLIRVYTLGSYLNPNEDGMNASIQCNFPDYLVKVRQNNEGTNIIHNENSITANFFWTSIGGNWFRLAPLEQEITGLSVGSTYNITCNQLTYQYSTGQVRADFTPVSFEARSKLPFNVSASVDSNDESLRYTIINTEKYPIYDIEFMWKTNIGDAYTEKIEELVAGETVAFEVFLAGQGNISLDASFVPVWQQSSLKPLRYSQTYVDSFSFSSGVPLIDRVIVDLNKVNQTKSVTLTKFPELLAENMYKARLVLDVDGIPVNADSLPTIKLRDPNGNVITTASMTNIAIGVYEFMYNVSSLESSGVWLTETYTTYKSVQIPRFDYWELEANPAQITVTVDETCLKDISAIIKIQNEGSSNQEYQYRCWITPNPLGQYEDADTLNRMQAAKLLYPSQLWERDVSMSIIHSGTYHFRCQVFFGTESSKAAAQFEARNCGSDTPYNYLTAFKNKILEPKVYKVVIYTTGTSMAALLLMGLGWNRRKNWRY